MIDTTNDSQSSIEERQRRQRAELRTELETELSDEALRQFDIMSELWDSGEMQQMLDSGDFSGIPDELRPHDDE